MTAGPARARAIAALAIVFVLGGVTGLGVARWIGPPAPPAPPLPGGLAELGLRRDQAEAARAILDRYRPELERAMGDLRPRLRAIQDRIDAELRPLLDAAQRATLDRLRATRPPPLGP